MLVRMLVGCLYIRMWEVCNKLMGILGFDFMDRNKWKFEWGLSDFMCFLRFCSYVGVRCIFLIRI